MCSPWFDVMSVMVHIGSLGGEVCKINALLDWTGHDLKVSIEQDSGISVHHQQLLLGSKELKDLEFLSARLTSGTDEHITLIRRCPEQAEWLSRVANDWHDLREAPENIQADEEVVLLAIKYHGSALSLAAGELRRSQRFVIACIQQSSESLVALAHVAAELRDDLGFWMAAVRSDSSGDVLKYAPEEIKMNSRELVLAGVRQNWRSLEHVPKKYFDDKEIINAAALQNLEALKFVNARAGLEAGMPLTMLAACTGRGSEFGSKVLFDEELHASGCGGLRCTQTRHGMSRRPLSARGGGFRLPVSQTFAVGAAWNHTKPGLPLANSMRSRPNSARTMRSRSAIRSIEAYHALSSASRKADGIRILAMESSARGQRPSSPACS